MHLKRVIISTVCISILLIAGGLWGGMLVKEHLENNLVNTYTQEETLIGNQISEVLQGKVQNIVNVFETLVINPTIQNGSSSNCNQIFGAVKASTKLQLNNLVRVNADGTFTCSLTNPSLIGTPVANLGNYWQQLQADPAHKPVLSHVINNKNVPDLAVALHVPMYDAQKRFIGSVGGAFYLKNLATGYLDNVKFAQTGYASLQDDDGTILYSHLKGYVGTNYFSKEFQTKNIELADLNRAVLAARKGQTSVVRYINLQHIKKIASVVPVEILPGHRWIIIVNVPITEISQTYVSTGLNQSFLALAAIFCWAVLTISGLLMINAVRDARLKRTEDQFISLVSHQLRTPLTAIRLFGEMLSKGQVGTLEPKQAEYVNNIHQSALRMIRLVSEILNVSRIELNRLHVEPTDTDLAAITNTHLEEVRPLAAEKHILLQFKPHVRPSLAIDQVLFGQVVHNLLTNAIRYSPDGSDVRISIDKQDKSYIFSVSDSGIGIPRSAQKRIFKRFYRADNAIASVGDGTGLGLYLVKMILEQSGCNIHFESTEGKGTTFYVTIPETGMRTRSGDKKLEKIE